MPGCEALPCTPSPGAALPAVVAIVLLAGLAQVCGLFVLMADVVIWGLEGA